VNILVLRSETDNTKAQKLALQLRTPQNIYNYVKDQVIYHKDGVFQSWRTPDETLKAKTGDCVDKSLLSKAMLDTIHIQNRMVIKYKNTEPQEAHIFNQILEGGHWIDFDTSCSICVLGRTFSKDWETVAIIFNNDTIIYDNEKYASLME